MKQSVIRSVLSIFTVAGCLALAPVAHAEVYGYVDANGVSHFSSTRLDARYTLFSKGRSGSGRVSVTLQPGQTSSDVLVAGQAPRIRAHDTVRVARRESRRDAVQHNSGPRELAHAVAHPGARRQMLVHAVVHQKPVTVKPSPVRYAALVANTARKQGVDQALVHAVITVESHYQAHAVSARGAAGLMQLMPDTAHRFGVSNRVDPAQNIAGGTRYLKTLLHRFKGNLSLAVAAYNAGEGAVMKYGNRVPPFRETQNYVASVLSLYHHFGGGQG